MARRTFDDPYYSISEVDDGMSYETTAWLRDEGSPTGGTPAEAALPHLLWISSTDMEVQAVRLDYDEDGRGEETSLAQESIGAPDGPRIWAALAVAADRAKIPRPSLAAAEEIARWWEETGRGRDADLQRREAGGVPQ